jgi:putative serine protease PepD
MSTSLFDPPPREPAGDPPPWSSRGSSEPPAPEGPARVRDVGRRSLAVLLVSAAALGGVAGTGALALAGAFDDGGGATGTTTPVSTTSTPTIDTSAPAGTLNPKALYVAAAPGVVDITSSGATDQSPFGGGSQGTATGTGFVVDRQGHIVTAAHVVDSASKVTVTLQDGTTRTARVLGIDDATDVAVLSINPSGLTLHPLTLGRSANMTVGDSVAAIGDPFGYARSLSTGIVSGIDRTIQAPNGFTVAHVIQTDAALNPGNSGGPVFDASGRVIGVADQIATGGSADANTGVGFATPIDLVKAELADLEAGRDVSHAFLGVATGTAASTAGAAVGSVSSGSPAASAGVRAGDTVVAVDGTAVNGSGDLVAAIAAHKPGDKVTLTVHRGSRTLKLDVTLGTQPTRATTQSP